MCADLRRYAPVLVEKLILMSIMFATVIIPAWNQRYASPRRGLVKTVKMMLLFNFVYMLAYLLWWPKLLWGG